MANGQSAPVFDIWIVEDEGSAATDTELTYASILEQQFPARSCRTIFPGIDGASAPAPLEASTHADPTRCFVIVLRSGDVLDSASLAQLAAVLDDTSVDLAYTDHQRAPNPSSGAAALRTAVLKPAWSPELLRSSNYLGPLCAIRLELVPPSWTSHHDLVLQASEAAAVIAHVPLVLATSRRDQPRDQAAVAAQLVRRAIPAIPKPLTSDVLLLEPSLTEHPLVSIVILTGGTTRQIRGRSRVLVEQAVESVLERSTYPNFEVVIVLDSRCDVELGRVLVAMDPQRIRFVQDDQPFNFSAANNLGARHAEGEILVFLNDDTEVVTPAWLDRMVMYLSMPDVGVVGARMHFSDGRIQHAGVVARQGWVEHRYAGYHHTTAGYERWLDRSSDVLAVTGACLAMRGKDFAELGEFPVEFPLNFNDIDMCLRAREHGLRVVIDQHCRLFHHETSSRKAGIDSGEQELFDSRWGHLTQSDPFHHPQYTEVRMEHQVPPDALRRLRTAVAETFASYDDSPTDGAPAAATKTDGMSKPRIVRSTPQPATRSTASSS